MSDLDRLPDREAIKALKHRYARLIDTKQWDEFCTLFTTDAEWDYVGLPRLDRGDENQEMRVSGTAHVKGYEKMLSGVVTVHHITMPEISFTGPDRAHAVWSLHDLLFLPTNTYEGWGHYFDDYVCLDGDWKISSIKMRRLHQKEIWMDAD